MDITIAITPDVGCQHSRSIYTAIDGLVSSWSENISVSFCLPAPGYGLTLWCTLGLSLQVPQLQSQLHFSEDEDLTVLTPYSLVHMFNWILR